MRAKFDLIDRFMEGIPLLSWIKEVKTGLMSSLRYIPEDYRKLLAKLMLSGFFHRNKRLLHSNNWMKKVLTRLALNIATASYIQVIVSGTLKCKLPFDQFFSKSCQVLFSAATAWALEQCQLDQM